MRGTAVREGDTVGRIVERVVADRLDEQCLTRLIAIGVDEISPRSALPDDRCRHRAGAIVWCAAGRNAATLQAFFDELGPERANTIRAVSIDMSGYEKAICGERAPGGGLLRPVSRSAPRAASDRPGLPRRVERARRSHTKTGKWIKGTRSSREHLDAWLARTSRSRLEPLVKLAHTIRRHRDGILGLIRLGLSNGRLEGLNRRIR